MPLIRFCRKPVPSEIKAKKQITSLAFIHITTYNILHNKALYKKSNDEDKSDLWTVFREGSALLKASYSGNLFTASELQL